MSLPSPDAIPRARAVISLSFFLFAGMLGNLPSARACPEPGNGEGSGPLALSVECVGGYPIRPLPTSVKWDGREYDVESGINVLMSVVRDPDKSADDRNFALLRLGMLDRHLKGRRCLDELARLYDGPGEVGKGAILLCFKASDDPRGIPVFVRTLDKEENMKLRLSAAAGLAQWNIRRGVAELVDLLDSKHILAQPARMPYVRDNALDLLRTKNRLKGWEVPDEEIRSAIDIQLGIDREEFKRWESLDEETRKSIEAQTRGLREKFDALYIAEVKKWFAENEHRFPDWKPGDPLPEGPVEAPKPKGSE